MPKHEALTPKAIANRIKAKGLQKLRWYCQMCQKQCRDENGFKCHTMSESHQRQLLLFADNPHRYMDSFSKEFADTFIQHLSRRFGTKRVHANQVYQEYISDRHHLHMNATRWLSLTSFVKWLGRTGKCTVDQTEKGWFITWIDRDPDTIRKQEAIAKKERLDMDDEERMAKFIEKQAERDQEGKESIPVVYTELQRESEDGKVAFSLTSSIKKDGKEPLHNSETATTSRNSNPLYKSNDVDKRKRRKEDKEVFKKPKSALDEIMTEQEKEKETRNRKDYWLTPGIVVKVTTKRLGEKYYKNKAVIMEVEEKYLGIIKMLDSGDKLKIDQEYLETVIPAPGRQVCIVNGAYRGCTASMVEVNMELFSATVKIDSGPTRGRIIPGIRYEDICKVHKD